MNRREALGLIALAPFAPATAKTAPAPAPAPTIPTPPEHARAAATRGQEPRFFTPHEMVTVAVLADMVIPADDRSGSATDAGVPEFIDFMMTDTRDENLPLRMRGGLAWLDAESRRRYQRPFVELSEAERTAIVDDIAWPERARPEMSHGVTFFNLFRDMVASGFWSSEMGIKDLQYMGNTAVQWQGCPPEALKKLGLSAG
ncbi:MAG TPA: gluconate 2-dehydrogenase subunit 3 family protein [Longimicrobiaceae bacterium]